MYRSRLALIILFVLVFGVTGCILDSEDGTYGTDGHVRDGAGKPVSDVLIRKTGSESGSTYTRSDGYYWLPLDRQSDEVILIAVKTGWAFCPGRIEISDFSMRHNNQDFTGFYGSEIVIDGFITDSGGNPVAGVKVVNEESGLLNGLTSVTNYLGYYRFNSIISGFKYRLVPYKPGCAFNPQARTYVLPARDYQRQDFIVSCVESFGIEGHVTDFYGNPIEGVALTMMPGDITAVTDGDGFYRVDGLSPSAPIVITPSRAGCMFSPGSWRVEAAPGGVGGVDFIVHCGETYSVRGRVFYDVDTPLADIGLYVEGGFGAEYPAARTDEEGRYEFTGLPDGFDYVIRPELREYAVAPESIVIEGLDRDYIEQNFLFSTERLEFRVEGFVRDREGTPLEGLAVEFGYLMPSTGAADAADAGAPDTPLLPAVTDEEGYFSIPLPRTYTVEFYVVKEGCYFVPYSRRCDGVGDHEAQNFVAHCGGGASISGYVHDIHGEPAPYVGVDLLGEGYHPPPFARTDSSGYYEFQNVPSGLELTVRPTSYYSIPYEGCIFCPPERVYGDVEEDTADQNFTISCPGR